MSKRKLWIIISAVILADVLLSIPFTNIMPDGTGSQSITWGQIFKYSRLLITGSGIVYILLSVDQIKMWAGILSDMLKNHISEIFLLLMFFYLAFYEISYAYCAYVYISPDSTGYLREAQAILDGNGFFFDRLAGYDSWFSSWPIGYPFLIAMTAFLTGRNVYLSSKLVSIICVGVGLCILHKRFKQDAWIYSLIYINAGFLTIYLFTWSENVFILSLLIWILTLSHIFEHDFPGIKWYIMLALSMISCFLTRYIGAFTVLFTSIYLGGMCIAQWLGKKDYGHKSKGLLLANLAAGITMISYLILNKQMSGNFSGVSRTDWWDDYRELTTNLYDSLLLEFFNAVRLDKLSILSNIKNEPKAILVLVLFVWILYVIVWLINHKADFQVLCLAAGLFYDVIFIYIRFHSSMDPFGYRFLVPGSVLISIGLIGYFQKRYPVNLKNLALVGIIILIVMTMAMIQNISTYTRETTYYHKYESGILSELSKITAGAMILNYDGEYSARAFRTDIMINGKIYPDDTINKIMKRYEASNSIWIKEKVMYEILNDETYNFDLKNYLNTLVDGRNAAELKASEAYICIYEK